MIWHGGFCMKTNRFSYICIAVIMTIVVINFPISGLASTDNSPPDFISCTPIKNSFSTGEDVVFELKASDPSGIDINNISILLRKTDKILFRVNLLFKEDITSPEDSDNGIYTFLMSCPVRRFASGSYEIESVWLQDNGGFRRGYYPPEITQYIIGIENSEQSDWDGPELVSIIIDKEIVSVGQMVNFTVNAIDESGVYRVFLHLCHSNQSTYCYVELSKDNNNSDTWKGSFTPTTTTKQGDYYLCFYMVDCIGNVSYIDSGDKKFYVSNPNFSPSAPTVESVTFSKNSVKPGDIVKIQVLVNANGSELTDYLYFYTQPVGMVDLCLDHRTGYYSFDWTVPANYQAGTYDIRIVIWEIDGTQTQYYGSCNNYTFPILRIQSVFTGLEDQSVLVGSSDFDPIAGVFANSESEGDMTNRIEVTGSVNTSQPGLYLLRYKIRSDQTVNYNGISTPVYYHESRWIGITDILPETTTSDAPLALTLNTLSIGASSSDVTISRNGNNISFSNTLTESGIYTVHERGASALNTLTVPTGTGTQNLPHNVYKSASSQSHSVKAVIDRSGPEIITSWQESGSSITVNVATIDVSGLDILKYKPDECSISDCRNNGITFRNSFTASSYGKYTIYAKDRLGNESIKVLNITPAPSPSAPPSSSSPSNYLSDITLSAGTLSRAFSKTTSSYKILLGEHQSSVTITPVREYDGASMLINKRAANAITLNVANGKSAKATVKVTYGKKSRTYTFTVTRAKSTNNNLGALSSTAGTWSAPFDPNVTNYTLYLDENTPSVILRSTTENASAKTSLKSKKFSLKNGQTRVAKITVRAQSGARKTYVVNIVRAKSTNANLRTLKAGRYLSPAFNANVTDYTVTLPAKVSSVTLSAKQFDRLSRVTIDGARRSSKKIKLQNGQSDVVRVVVTSQAGTAKEYMITVRRE